FNVPHDSTDNVGYSVTYENRSFCLITDAGHINENMEQYIHNANYLVLEANYDELMLKNGPYPEYLKLRISSDNGHLCNNAAAEALLKNGSDKLKKIWLCHLSEENNHPELARKTIETMLTNNGFFEGKEVSIEVLKRKVPSELYSL
ncbi:MAG: MBL fold metallo-hydrolase, partial [Bacteroidaceae bacterium]